MATGEFTATCFDNVSISSNFGKIGYPNILSQSMGFTITFAFQSSCLMFRYSISFNLKLHVILSQSFMPNDTFTCDKSNSNVLGWLIFIVQLGLWAAHATKVNRYDPTLCCVVLSNAKKCYPAKSDDCQNDFHWTHFYHMPLNNNIKYLLFESNGNSTHTNITNPEYCIYSSVLF